MLNAHKGKEDTYEKVVSQVSVKRHVLTWLYGSTWSTSATIAESFPNFLLLVINWYKVINPPSSSWYRWGMAEHCRLKNIPVFHTAKHIINSEIRHHFPHICLGCENAEGGVGVFVRAVIPAGRENMGADTSWWHGVFDWTAQCSAPALSCRLKEAHLQTCSKLRAAKWEASSSKKGKALLV